MYFDLDDDTKLLQGTVREFAVEEIAPVAASSASASSGTDVWS